MSKSIPTRLIALLLLLLLVLVGPWWLALIVAIISVWYFKSFYEVILPALLFDVLYGSALSTRLGFQFIASVLVIIIVAGLDELKSHVMLSS